MIFIGTLLLVALIVIVVYLVQSDPFQDTRPQEQPTTQPAQEEPAGHMEFGDAMKSYGQMCANCHGRFGEGLAGFPPLQNSELTIDEIKDIIKNGKGNMDGFEHIEEPMLTELAEFIKKL